MYAARAEGTVSRDFSSGFFFSIMVPCNFKKILWKRLHHFITPSPHLLLSLSIFICHACLYSNRVIIVPLFATILRILAFPTLFKSWWKLQFLRPESVRVVPGQRNPCSVTLFNENISQWKYSMLLFENNAFISLIEISPFPSLVRMNY